MSLHLFAGLCVRDFQVARPWYERVLGDPAFFPHATEARWDSAERHPTPAHKPDGGSRPTLAQMALRLSHMGETPMVPHG
jgi:hypothetical protein